MLSSVISMLLDGIYVIYMLLNVIMIRCYYVLLCVIMCYLYVIMCS